MKEKVIVNSNINIWVKLKDLGIEHYVKNHNSILPFQLQISFNEFKKRANEFGYHEFQLWTFIDCFGGLGMCASDYFSVNLVCNKEDLQGIFLEHIGAEASN